MTDHSLSGTRVLVTGGAGTIGSHLVDQLLDAGVQEIIVLDNFVRGRRDNLALALPSGRVRIVDGDIRDSRLVDELTAGNRRHVSPGRNSDHAVRRGAAAGARGDGRWHLQRARGGGQAPRVEGRGRLVCLGLRPRRHVPDRRATPSLRERHPVRRGQDLQRGAPAQLQRDVRARLRGAALLQRVRAADGHPRRLHRGAGPLDGADRRGPAAADQSATGAQTMDFIFTEDIARANVLAAQADVTDEVFNVASRHRDEPARARAEAALRRWTPISTSSSDPSER